MPRNKIRLTQLVDFTGGLNLRKDAFLLNDTEVPEAIDVDFDPRGGVGRRGVFRPWSLTNSSFLKNMAVRDSSAGARQILVHDGTNVKYHTAPGSGPTLVTATQNVSPFRVCTFKGFSYFVGANTLGVGKWDTVFARLGTATAFNNNLTAPTTPGVNGWIPPCKSLVEHQGHLWAANIKEGSTVYANRVRWSHPNFGEDWRATDAIDVATGTEGDSITALVSLGDQLVVFKNSSVHAITGVFPNFSVQPLTDAIGAISQEAVAVSEEGIYFFSWPDGLFRYDGRKFQWVGEAVWPAVQDGSINSARPDVITVGIVNRRVWVGVPWATSTFPNRTFVYDPHCGKNGAWTFYGRGFYKVLMNDQPGTTPVALGVTEGSEFIIKLDQLGDEGDDLGYGVIPNTFFDAFVRTKWVDLGEPAVRKKWKRPDFVIKSGMPVRLQVTSYLDYDPSDDARTFFISTEADSEYFILDDGIGTSLSTMAADDDTSGIGVLAPSRIIDRNEIERGSPLGKGRAVSLLIKQVYDSNIGEKSKPWKVDAITFKYVPRRIRS